MKLKVKLNNPKYCDGCPLLIIGITGWCNYYDSIIYNEPESIIRHYHYKFVRLKKCIKENGE